MTYDRNWPCCKRPGFTAAERSIADRLAAAQVNEEWADEYIRQECRKIRAAHGLPVEYREDDRDSEIANRCRGTESEDCECE